MEEKERKKKRNEGGRERNDRERNERETRERETREREKREKTAAKREKRIPGILSSDILCPYIDKKYGEWKRW